MSIQGILDVLKLNPFPDGDPRRAQFTRTAQTIGEEQARLTHTFLERLRTTPDEQLNQLQAEACAAVFDLWARVASPLAATQPSEVHLALLESLAKSVFDRWVNYPQRWIPASWVVGVQQRLNERKFFWVAEALKTAREAAVAQSDSQPCRAGDPRPRASGSKERRAAVDSYLAEASVRTGRRLTRTDFWKEAGYKTRTEFERWQRNDPRATAAAARAFERILKNKPHCR